MKEPSKKAATSKKKAANQAASPSEDAQKDQLLTATIPHIPFDGWHVAALKMGAKDLGWPAEIATQLFPKGGGDMIAWYAKRADERMVTAFLEADTKSMKIREKVAFAVRLRLEQNSADREILARALAFLSLPQNACLSARLVYATVDNIWRVMGDTSTDWNFYSKRVLLAGVFSSTVVYWLNDRSENASASWAFLDRRIENVMQVPRLKNNIGTVFSGVFGRFTAFRQFRGSNRGRKRWGV